MGKIDYRQKMQHKSGLKFWISDVDAYVSDEAGTIIVNVYRDAGLRETGPRNIYAAILFEMCWDKKTVDFFWEPDGQPTFVDYGSQSVLYDSGEGGPDHIELDNFVVFCDDWKYVDDDEDLETELTDEQVAKMLECSETDLLEIIEEVKPLLNEAIKAEVERYYEDHSNWPDKDEYLAEYNDWYDCDWD